jgi:O-antigen/teichoic acid export membrane protein
MYFHKPRYSLYIVAISAFIVVFLSFILVQKYGFIGSGYAILAGSIVAYLVDKYFSFKMLRMEYVQKD